jgi:hypothetical protein
MIIVIVIISSVFACIFAISAKALNNIPTSGTDDSGGSPTSSGGEKASGCGSDLAREFSV